VTFASRLELGRKKERQMNRFTAIRARELRNRLLNHKILPSKWWRNLARYDDSRFAQRHQEYAIIDYNRRLFDLFPGRGTSA
jgi:hypothetical protein